MRSLWDDVRRGGGGEEGEGWACADRDLQDGRERAAVKMAGVRHDGVEWTYLPSTTGPSPSRAAPTGPVVPPVTEVCR